MKTLDPQKLSWLDNRGKNDEINHRLYPGNVALATARGKIEK